MRTRPLAHGGVGGSGAQPAMRLLPQDPPPLPSPKEGRAAGIRDCWQPVAPPHACVRGRRVCTAAPGCPWCPALAAGESGRGTLAQDPHHARVHVRVWRPVEREEEQDDAVAGVNGFASTSSSGVRVCMRVWRKQCVDLVGGTVRGVGGTACEGRVTVGE